MTGNKHDKNKYKIDFPEEGYFNWKTVKIKNNRRIAPRWQFYGKRSSISRKSV